MRYSTDLRQRVLDFVAAAGSIAEAARRFQISRTCIYTWLDAADPLSYKKLGPRKPHRLDPEALAEHVKQFPDSTQKERAAHFGVSQQCVWHGLKKIGCTRKKKTFTYKEQCPIKQEVYKTELQTALQNRKTPVFVDESGFTIETIVWTIFRVLE